MDGVGEWMFKYQISDMKDFRHENQEFLYNMFPHDCLFYTRDYFKFCDDESSFF